MIDGFCHEYQAHDRQADIVRRAEFLRQIHDSEMAAILVPATGLRADIAGLLRRTADRLDRRATRPLMRVS